MLPNLSDRCKRLQLLVPVSVEPAWMSSRRQALLQLKTIVNVRVSSRTGRDSNARYTIEVFRSCSDNNESPTSVETTAPAHRDVHCEFCSELVQLFVLGSSDPEAMSLRLLGEERALRKLTKLLNDLLTLTVRNSSVNVRRVCSGQAHIPKMLYDFLFDPAPVASETTG
ncbi:hypothetical protein BBO99_00004312 [Phytophthora kernoviae]|uniref:Uncharacterized protein n=1 Tax=Phytophthora kernoviae TaxID=325452 RepID=A0A3R7K033_9STRA|nr:hypothetical protein BBI17_004424 [Phytophthora kernoviae]RLN80689.1 hypothetical protein BBO99_00004312 [Phytophthora kernoviae]